MPKYGEVAYWNERYQNQQNETFDWLEDYNSLKTMFQKILKSNKEAAILNLGCGNSIICEDLYDDGFHNIINIDISHIVIQQMQERNKQRNMQFIVMDALQLQFENDSFDLVIDKSTMDAILCGNSSFTKTAQMIQEIQRVLKPNGVYLMISYGDPSSRVHHLTRQNLYFSVKIKHIEKQVKLENNEIQILKHYIYICQKQAMYDKNISYENYEQIMKELENEEKMEHQQVDQQEQEQDELEQLIAENNQIPLQVLLDKIKSQPQYQQLLKELGYN